MYPEVLNGIEVGGIYIHEPGSVLSNALIVISSLILLKKIGSWNGDFQKYWSLFILLIGLAAFGGMFSHGIPTYFGEAGFYWVWAIKSAVIPIANIFVVLGLVCIEKKSKMLSLVLWLKALLVIIALFAFYNFLPAVIDLGLTYIFALIFSAKLRKYQKRYHFIFASFVVAFVTGLIYPFKLDIDPLWFTHKDIAHIFAIVSLALIYKAIIADKKAA